jgi:hypothetical protein
MSTVIKFPGSLEGLKAAPEHSPADEVEYRSRGHVQADIDEHVKARKAYGKAVAWEAACRDGDAIEQQLEEAREYTERRYQEMQYAGRSLLITMPTDPKGLVDLLMYLEKLQCATAGLEPQRGTGPSLALELLRTMRLSLREITKYGKYGPTS